MFASHEIEIATDAALVATKDSLIWRIDNAADTRDLDHLLIVLDWLVPIWLANNYGYKGVELCERISHRTTQMEVDDPDNGGKAYAAAGIREFADVTARRFHNYAGESLQQLAAELRY